LTLHYLEKHCWGKSNPIST